jgi:dephospho-CoA kinase
MAAHRHYVFGYGSLLERHGRSGGPMICELEGYRRVWNVAMDNSQTIPGYKHYVARDTGARGAWFVTFLNIVPDPDATVNGVLFEVDEELLERLDRRERNYERIEVSSQIAGGVDGRVWAYVGSRDAVRRFELGCQTGRAVISRGYRDRVRKDFAAAGDGTLSRFDDLTDPLPCPILDLRRVDHEDRPRERPATGGGHRPATDGRYRPAMDGGHRPGTRGGHRGSERRLSDPRSRASAPRS